MRKLLGVLSLVALASVSLLCYSWFTNSATYVEKVDIQKIADVSNFSIKNNKVSVSALNTSKNEDKPDATISFDVSELVVVRMKKEDMSKLTSLDSNYYRLSLYFSDVQTTIENKKYKPLIENLPIFPSESKDKYIYFVDDVTYAEMGSQVKGATFYEDMNSYSNHFKTLTVDIKEMYNSEKDRVKIISAISDNTSKNYSVLHFGFYPIIAIIVIFSVFYSFMLIFKKKKIK